MKNIKINDSSFLVLLTDTMHSTLEDVRDLLIIVILNSFLTTNIIHLTSALQTFIQLKRKDLVTIKDSSCSSMKVMEDMEEQHANLLINETKYEVHQSLVKETDNGIKSHDSTFDSVNYEDLP